MTCHLKDGIKGDTGNQADREDEDVTEHHAAFLGQIDT
jgi:hypothetical protein